MIQVWTIKSADELWKLSLKFSAKGCIYEVPKQFPASAIILDYPHYVQIDFLEPKSLTSCARSLAANLEP